MDGVNCLKATEPLRGDSFLFTTKFPEIPGTHLIALGRMKTKSTLKPPNGFEHGTLTTRSLMVNFPNQIPDCDSNSPALLDLFLSSDTSICSTMAFPPLGNSDHVVVFLSNSKCDVPFHYRSYDYSCPDSDDLRDYLRDVPWEDIFKLGASTAASEFCEWVQVGIAVYISHHKYQVKPHSSPWFSAACAAVIVHRNHFFCLYQQNKSSKSKGKFRQASNHCNRVLEDPKLAYANKTTVYHFSENWFSRLLTNC